MSAESTSLVVNEEAFARAFGEAGPFVAFSADLVSSDPITGKDFSMRLYNCLARRDHFVSFDLLEFECFADSEGRVCKLDFEDAEGSTP
jgi:hypothetical protein